MYYKSPLKSAKKQLPHYFKPHHMASVWIQYTVYVTLCHPLTLMSDCLQKLWLTRKPHYSSQHVYNSDFLLARSEQHCRQSFLKKNIKMSR